MAANKKVVDYLRLHEHSIFQPCSLEPGLLAEPNDIFHSEAVESHHHHRKRRTSSNSETTAEMNLSTTKRIKPNNTTATVGIGHMSPPLHNFPAQLSALFPRKEMFSGGGKWSSVYPGKLAIVPGCPSTGAGVHSVQEICCL